MADISKEIQAFQEAIYGEEVRGSMISLAEKMNKVSEDTEKAEKNRATAETKRVNAEKEREQNATKVIQNCENATGDANTAAQAAEEATSAANTAAKTARDSATSANAAAGKANEAAQSANSAADGANTAEGAATTAAEAATAAAGKADTAASNANSKASTANTAAGKANEAADRANKAAQDAEDVVAGKGFVLASEKGEPGGVATLDDSGKVPDDQIPDISEKTVTFEMATKRANVQSGDSLAVAFGKLALYCADLKPHAFSNPVDNLLGTDPELPLAATQGTELYRLFNELNGNLKKNFGQSGGLALKNSTYYPTSYIYKSGQIVYLRCSGLAAKEIKAGAELTIAVEGGIPEEYRPHISSIFFPVITASGGILRVLIDATGKITYTAQKDISAGVGINLHVIFHTGKAVF